ncbi:MAG TPA: pentapeptide repeat-containing protein [Pyrinomonadaceae bacterium]|nr:pentapeptide repeat-containing protein [Pyrinomonadaceae bacterium]
MIDTCILLLLASNAVDTVDPLAANEIRGINEAIQSSTHRKSFKRLQHPGLRVSDIRKWLLRHKPHILHISGHARPTEGLVLENDNGKTAKIKCVELVNLILRSTDDARLRLVFFSFCYSEACATAILAKVPYAVGVRDEIRAESLLLFSKVFYEALGSNKSVHDAFDIARECLKTEGWEGSDEMVLRVHSGTSAEVPFLSSMGFVKKSVEEALQIHRSEILSRYFEEPVWSQPGLTLDKSYVDLECGSLTWGDITESIRRGGGSGLNPLDESSAPRTNLLAATLDWLQKENLQEFLVIEGSPGSGKSSFTIRLSVKLVEQGYQPIRVRLRDLGKNADDEPIAEIAKKILEVDPAELEYALEHNQTKAMLILDGWDELTLLPDQNLINRVGNFLESIRNGVLDRWKGRIPVILTGRPTKAVTTARNMTENTRILTIYRFSPAQLREYLVKLDSIYSTASNMSPEIEIILQRYEDDWRLSQGVPSSQVAGTIDVVGWPLLAHVAYRLMRECEPSRQTSLIADRTMLLRCLTEYYCIHSRKPSDEPSGTEVRSRLEAPTLRSLVQETAIAMTVKGTECISQEELRRDMASWSGRSKADRDLKLAGGIDPDIFLINYLFKSGVEYLGCEFIHKSLREFAFAQAVVDNLKRLAVPSDTKREYNRDLMTEGRLAILSRQWLSREIWDHIERQVSWEIYRESPELEDPIAFQRGERPLGIDAWCRIRDRLTQRWTSWAFSNPGLSPTKSDWKPDPKLAEMFKGVSAIDSAGADARFGAALFRLCAMLHGILAARILETSGLMNYQKNMWEELGVTVPAGSEQTTLNHTPDQRLRFFSPGKGDEILEPTMLRSSMARINAYYAHTKEELPEKCDLTFLVATGAALERLSFQYCNLSYSNFSESNLSGADMQGADLSGAWLCKSNLTRANLNMTDLPYASFRQANLEGASLKSANIEFADFREAKGLSLEQVSVTTNWESAKFDPEFLAKLRELKNSDEQMPLEPSESQFGA